MISSGVYVFLTSVTFSPLTVTPPCSTLRRASALDAAKAERESHYLVKYLYTNYTQAMFPQIREAWQAEIDQLITQIYKINKPLTRLIKIERIKE